MSKKRSRKCRNRGCGWAVIVYLCLVLVVGCGGGELSGGDEDLEIDGDSDIEVEEEQEAEARPRPENPADVEYPKTLWRDEVETGQTFTWGFFPRDYYPQIPTTGMNFPIVWDEANKRILAIDPTKISYNKDWDFVLYSLTEETSEILDYIKLPEISEQGWEPQTTPPEVIDSVIIDDRLYLSFYKDGWLYENPDYVASGILAYDLTEKESHFHFLSIANWSEIDIIGRMKEETEESIVMRKESGFYRVSIQNNYMELIRSYCDPDGTYYSACGGINKPEYSNYGGFLFPILNRRGWAEFIGRLVSIDTNENGDWLLETHLEPELEVCKHWVEYPECEAAWLPFSLDCCISNKSIISYNGITYVLSGTHSALFIIDAERGGLQRVAGVPMQSNLYGFAPNGTPASDAILGSTQHWLVTDDGDVMWLSPYDYSIRGIAGPLDEWTQ